jgi:hypothetical protein
MFTHNVHERPGLVIELDAKVLTVHSTAHQAAPATRVAAL